MLSSRRPHNAVPLQTINSSEFCPGSELVHLIAKTTTRVAFPLSLNCYNRRYSYSEELTGRRMRSLSLSEGFLAQRSVESQERFSGAHMKSKCPAHLGLLVRVMLLFVGPGVSCAASGNCMA